MVTSDADNWFLRYKPTRSPGVPGGFEAFLCYVAPVHYNAIRRRPAGDALRSSFGRRHSRVLREVERYTAAAALPDNPVDLVAR